MARPPRLDLVGLPQHLVARGNNRCALFLDDADRRVLMRYLQDAVVNTGSELHAYVLMTNHVHLLATGTRPGGVSRMMQAVGRRFATYANKRQERTGTLFEGRFRASVVQTERYFLACMRYIEMNPVRAGMVGSPHEFFWSSYAENASGNPTGVLTPHPEYVRLGPDREARAAAYRALFQEVIPAPLLADIRSTLASNAVLGEADFHRQVRALTSAPRI